MEKKAFDTKEKFIDRDLSWLFFNERVLAEAANPANPPLEKVRFLAIFVNNLDEFLAVRVAGLKRLIDSGHNKENQFGYYPHELYVEIGSRIGSLVKKLYDIYQNTAAELAKSKIFLKKYNELDSAQKKFTKRYFDITIFPIITPMAVDQGHPFPVLSSRATAFAVNLSKQDKLHFAILPTPKVIPRLIKLPSSKDEFHFILMDEIIKNNLDSFFRGYKVSESLFFKVIRDSELSVDEEYTPDLLKAIESEVKKRPRASVIHLEVEKTGNKELLEALCQGLNFSAEDVFEIDGSLDLSCLFELISQINKTELFYPSFIASKPEYENIFDKIKESDLLLHMPYQSFEPTVDLIRSAAKDDNVLAIKMTLYRTNEESLIVKALKDAAFRRKQVTVLVELKARFDEEKNINWAKDLEDAGCHVIYGIAGMKVHSKIALIVRREEEGIKRYVHLATGNYNEKTACVYTDIGYFTANDDFAKDVSDAFNVITGYSVPSRWKRIVSSPYDLRAYFFELIDKEIEFQKKYKNGQIFAKFNSLEDTQIINKLYEASSAGVKVKLIVRGICSLVPGVSELSDNIEVKSIVGRFLEHSRIYMFNNNSDFRVFLSSADWMSRNFDRRIELLFEILKDEFKEHLKFVLETYWKDMAEASVLTADRDYVLARKGQGQFNAQDYFLGYYSKPQ